MIDKLLLGHVGLPLVLDLAVHLVNFFGWMSQGDHSETLLILALFNRKVMGWVGWGGLLVAHVILVSALNPSPSSFLFWGLLFYLGQGHGGLGLGPGLDNKS